MKIDGTVAVRILQAFGVCDPGYCLHYVWQAYASAGARTDRSAPTAMLGWERSEGKHPGDRNPPVGVPVWWGRRYDGNDDGDVVISLGGGQVVATDWPTGRIGTTTIDRREAQIGREYLGWTECIFDVPVLDGVAGATPEPEPSEEDDMLMLKITGGQGLHFAALGLGVFRHFIDTDPIDKIMRIARAQDDWQEVTFDELPALLRTYGCDLHIWDVRGGSLVVLDPLDGSVRAGNVWTATGAARSAIADMPAVTSSQTAAYLRGIVGGRAT